MTFTMHGAVFVSAICVTCLVSNTMAFVAPTAQLNPLFRPQQSKPAVSLRPGTAGNFASAGLGELRRSKLAGFMSEDYNPPADTEDVEQLAAPFSEVSEEFSFETSEGRPLSETASPVEAVKQMMSKAADMSEQTATWWLILVVALSGINFGVVKSVAEVFDSPTLLFGRFAVATACLSPWLFGAPKKVLAGGAESGAWLAAGYISQAISLAGGTPSSICSFFASLSCIICPFIEQFLGVRLDRKAWVAAALAIAGAGVLELGSGTLPTQNDLIALLQPLLFGIYLIRTEDAMKNSPDQAMEITALQVAATTGIAAVWGAGQAVGGGVLDAGHAAEWLGSFGAHPKETLELLYMGAVPSALALAVETVVLAKLSSSKTALLFSTEPIFAAAFGASFLGESVGANVILGGALATTACLVRSLSPADVKNAWADLQAKLTQKEA